MSLMDELEGSKKIGNRQLAEPQSGQHPVPQALRLPPPAAQAAARQAAPVAARRPGARLHRQPNGGRDPPGRGHPGL